MNAIFVFIGQPWLFCPIALMVFFGVVIYLGRKYRRLEDHEKRIIRSGGFIIYLFFAIAFSLGWPIIAVVVLLDVIVGLTMSALDGNISQRFTGTINTYLMMKNSFVEFRQSRRAKKTITSETPVVLKHQFTDNKILDLTK